MASSYINTTNPLGQAPTTIHDEYPVQQNKMEASNRRNKDRFKVIVFQYHTKYAIRIIRYNKWGVFTTLDDEDVALLPASTPHCQACNSVMLELPASMKYGPQVRCVLLRSVFGAEAL